MNGSHSVKSSKKPVIIICIAAAVIIAVVCVIIFLNVGKKSETPAVTTQSTTSQVMTQQETDANVYSSEIQQQTSAESNAESQGETSEAQNSETQNVVVPTNSEEEVKYFNATYAPYKAVDTLTGDECTLKEVFGSSYGGGVITFNSDGSFSESFASSSVNSGAYAVEGDSIIATYTNDKNMSVTVTQWDGDTPSELIINYGGYDVYFSL